MKRRRFLTLLGGALWPLAARAQQPLPTVGFLSSRTTEQAASLVASLRGGLEEAGYGEGRNVAIAYRYADGHYDRLPELAKDLVAQNVAVIVAGGTSGPAMAATKTIPIVFTSGIDPIAGGLVNSLNRPDGNVTGATFYSGALGGKQMEVLLQLAPKTAAFGLMVNPNGTSMASQMRDVQKAAHAIGREAFILNAPDEKGIDAAFAKLAETLNAALLVSVDPYFDSRPAKLIELAARHAVPTVYYLREFVQAGGLVSYGASITDTYRQAGLYAGRILKGEKPSDLPIQLPTKFELSINLKTAKALGLTVPQTFLATADELVE